MASRGLSGLLERQPLLHLQLTRWPQGRPVTSAIWVVDEPLQLCRPHLRLRIGGGGFRDESCYDSSCRCSSFHCLSRRVGGLAFLVRDFTPKNRVRPSRLGGSKFGCSPLLYFPHC